MRVNNPAITHKMFIEKFVKHDKCDITNEPIHFFLEEGLEVKGHWIKRIEDGFSFWDKFFQPPLESLPYSTIIKLYYKLDK